MNFLLSVLRQLRWEQAKLRKRRAILASTECDHATEEDVPRPLSCQDPNMLTHDVLVRERHP